MKLHEAISPPLQAFIERQPLFFIATAPLAATGHVNVSPKGMADTFAVVDEHTVAYLDLTGSGSETVAHLRENGRITVMFCAFDGAPNIVRLHGVGRYLTPNDPEFSSHRSRFGDHPGVRGVVVVDVGRVSDSCGYAVPNLASEGDRGVLDAWAHTRGEAKLAAYQRERNASSIDGLPALPAD